MVDKKTEQGQPETDAGVPDPLDETPPKPAADTEKKPAADSNPNPGPYNMLDTEGLSPAEAALINGTVLDGANGAHVTGSPAAGLDGQPGKPARSAADVARGDPRGPR